jgi:hypothetical protein
MQGNKTVVQEQGITIQIIEWFCSQGLQLHWGGRHVSLFDAAELHLQQACPGLLQNAVVIISA